MKKSTVLNKGRSIIISPKILEKIRANKLNTIILPITNKELYEYGDYLYCKESIIAIPNSNVETISFIKTNFKPKIENIVEETYSDGYTYFYNLTNNKVKKYIESHNDKFYSVKQCPKDLSRTFLKVNTSCVCDVKSLSDDMLKSLNCKDIKDLIKLWDDIVNYYLDINTKNESQKTKLYKSSYCYDSNPMVQIINVDNIDIIE